MARTKFRHNTSVDRVVYSFLAALCLAHILLYQRIQAWDPDSAYYLGLARSIAEHRTYTFDSRLYITYPPGFPTVLAILETALGNSYQVSICSMAVWSFLGLFAAYKALQVLENQYVAAGAVLLLAASPYFFTRTTQLIASEPPYFAFSMLALYLATKADAPPPSRQTLWSFGFAFAVLGGLMTRAAGITLMAALFVWVGASFLAGSTIGRRRLRFAAPAIVFSVAAQLCWIGWTHHAAKVNPPESYMEQYQTQLRVKDLNRPEAGLAQPMDYVRRAPRNLTAIGATVSQFVLSAPWVQPRWHSPATLGPICLILLGLVTSLRLVKSAYLDWYFVCYFIMCLFWWFYVDSLRYLFPVVLLAFLYCYRGAVWLYSHAKSHPLRFNTVGVCLCSTLSAYSAGYLVLTRDRSLQMWLTFLIWSGLLGTLALTRRAAVSAQAGTPVTSTMTGARIVRWSYRIAVLALILLILLGVSKQASLARYNLAPNATHFLHYSSMNAAAWVSSNTPESAVIMGGMSSIIHILSGRRALNFPVSSDPDFLMRSIYSQDVRVLIVVDPSRYPFFVPTEPDRLRILMRAYPTALTHLFDGPGYQIFRINPVAGPV